MESRTASGLLITDRRAASIPNTNDPLDVPPATVGPPSAVPGDPHGLVVTVEERAHDGGMFPPVPAAWSGWPGEWGTPNWWGHVELMTDTAWLCLDLNASILASMPPYFVGVDGVPEWIDNPDPLLYSSWDEFAKQLAWDYQMGEAFVLATAWYDNQYPARFHVVSPWLVTVELVNGLRRYKIGERDVTADMLHIRYTSRTNDAHGHGPLEAGSGRVIAANALSRYATQMAAGGGVPNSVLVHPSNLNADQAADLQAHWVAARMSSMGLPAVLSGGLDFKTLQVTPKDMALVELAQWNEARIAVLLGVPPFLAGLPSGGDSMTYSNVQSIFDYHWRAGLRPKASAMMSALSSWALPLGSVELNRDEYVRPGPYERAQTWAILVNLGVLTVEQVQEIERYSVASPTDTLSAGVLE